MRIIRRKLLQLAVTCGVVFLSLSVARAETPTELLEQGIYKEETVGNLDEAIEIYRKIVAEGEKTRARWQPQYRLANCLKKQGKDVAAVEAFQKLVKDFAEQKELVAEAKKQLPDELKLLPAPWKDGERLTLTMKLPGGQPIGIVGLAVDAGDSEGRGEWRMLVRRFLLQGENQGVSHIVVDRKTNQPLRTTWTHSLLGTCDANYTGDKLTVHTKGKAEEEDTKKVLNTIPPVFSNDQVFYVLRQLPLQVGYKAAIPTRIAFTGGNQVDIGIEVPKKETLNTPVGEFDCFRVEMNIGQTFWIADTPERYLVQLDGGGVIGTLSAIETNEPHTYENAEAGYSVTAPAGWFTLPADWETKKTRGTVYLVAPEFAAAMIQVRDKESLDAEDRESTQAWAKSSMKSSENYFKGYQLRGDGPKEAEVAGLSGLSFEFDQTSFGRPGVVEVALALGPTKAVSARFFAADDEFKSLAPQAEAIRNSLRVKKP